MPSYCCFFCPANDFTERDLSDKCPRCGAEYGFPLLSAPEQIGDRKVVEPLARGFYACTYIVERTGGLRGKSVLKVTPKSFYDFFTAKDFGIECRTHELVAEGTEHLVKIRDMRSEMVSFGAEIVECCVAELDYVPGRLLTTYLNGDIEISASVAAQIAIDLLRLKEELEKKQVFHNDLHAQNIIVEELSRDRFRADAINPSIRVVAIDLGSVTDRSKSDPEKARVGDLRWIGRHIEKLIERLVADPDRVSDHDYRLASALQSIFHALAAPAQNQRLPAAHELIEQIRSAYEMLPRHSWRPWKTPLVLSSFGSYYNAQTLQSWHVPALLVDPEGTWLGQISTPGPQVITGMRGCGKTMLLRALQFHARAAQAPIEGADSVKKRVSGDPFVGLFVSAQRLLDKPDEPEGEAANDPFARLFLAYALEAVRSLMHLKDVIGNVDERAHKFVANAVSSVLTGNDAIRDSLDLDDLDSRLNRCLVTHSRLSDAFNLSIHPSEAFSQLATAIRAASPIWSNVQVLYLLDDVSTRYLKPAKITQLLSELLFQNPSCAFKITSEVQTMELELTTPGSDLRAREGRDLAVFDLGSAVYDKIKGRHGKHFVEQILAQRAAHFSAHPNVKPSQVLGDVNLEDIALEITKTSSTSAKRKEVYRGITALAHVCVGDIGDVISLYERIIRAANGKLPVPSRVQSDCFQDHCSHRLYDLNRRGGELKDAARSFAEASYELLVRSAKEAKNRDKPERLRQYASIYVRVTTGDTDKQRMQLRDLVDAGVFVFTGGKPRTKTKDSDPISQFKLTFRRIYGLTNFIGLAERDRFELSGPDLEEWLSNPANGKEILLRNLGGPLPQEGVDGEAAADEQQEDSLGLSSLPLFPDLAPQYAKVSRAKVDLESRRGFGIAVSKLTSLASEKINAVVLGLGFEERTLKSALAIMGKRPPCKIYAVEYAEKGYGDAIVEAAERWGADLVRVPYEKVVESGLEIPEQRVVVDVTGLAKPVIFHVVRKCLRKAKRIVVAHTQAKSYYPTDSDLRKLLRAEERHNREQFFQTLSSVLTGEAGPYRNLPLMESDADETRRTVMVAFASPKHERLLSLIDAKVIDRLEIVAPCGDSARNRVARYIADIAATDSSNSEVTLIDSDDLDKMIRFLSASFAQWYTEQNFNFEIGLTGSKMAAVAAGAVSASCKVGQCWYVHPREFDAKRFTKGSGATRLFALSLS